MRELSVAEAAEACGLKTTALRYYEQAGLIPPVARDGSGRRVFTEQDLAWIRYAVCLRSLGMGVSDIARYVSAANRPDGLERAVGVARRAPRSDAGATRCSRPLHRGRSGQARRQRRRHVIEQVPLGRTGRERQPHLPRHDELRRPDGAGRRPADPRPRAWSPASRSSTRRTSTATSLLTSVSAGAGARSSSATGLRGRRDEMVVATKMFFPMHDGPGAIGASRRNVIRECEASLRRLRHGLHRPLPAASPVQRRAASTRRSGRSTISSPPGRCATSGPAPSPPGRSSSRSGCRPSGTWFRSRPSSPSTTSSIVAASASSSRWRSRTASGCSPGPHSPAACSPDGTSGPSTRRPARGTRRSGRGRQEALTDGVFDAVDRLAEIALGGRSRAP